MTLDTTTILQNATAAADPPAAACCAFLDGARVYESAHGALPDGSETTPECIFDLASVTKVVATTPAVAVLVARGALDLDTPVARWLPELGKAGKDRVTSRELLGHRSGLPAWRPFFTEVIRDPQTAGIFSPDGLTEDAAWERSRATVLDGVFATRLERPNHRVYSDLGFLALGALVERVSGTSLQSFCHEALWRPLAVELGYVDLREPSSWVTGRHVLPTGRTRPREPAPGQEHLYVVPEQPERPDPGRVDDDNAFAMAGVAGHAGVFGTARAVARFGAALLEEIEGAGQLGCGEALRSFFTLDPAHGSPRGLGFDVPTGERSSAGRFLGRGPRGAFGHLGFTGCSLWLDLDRHLSVALLTNRTWPGRHRVEGIRALRPAVHDALIRELGLDQ